MPKKKITHVALLLLLVSASLLTFSNGRRLAAAGQEAGFAAQAGNMLQNPGFEGGFQAWNGIPEVQVAANWTPWWWEDPDHNPAYFRPEYKRALASIYPRRVLGGESAQQWFTFYASHVAGMYQQVFNVAPGQRYRFSVWAQVWSSTEDNPGQSISPANPHLQIGIDPTGNWNAGGPTVIWSGEAPMSGVIDQWGLMTVEATAENNVITVFMRTNPDFANKHNDMYWDNAALEAVQPPLPTAPPSPTPGPATNTPAVEPSATPANTATPTVTDTPAATITETVSPTAMPSPTETMMSTPTETATTIPTDTPIPTATAAPTETPGSAGQQDAIPDQPAGQDAAGVDSLSVVTLVALGVAIALLCLLIIIMVRGMRAR
jgi:hypothetical protein